MNIDEMDVKERVFMLALFLVFGALMFFGGYQAHQSRLDNCKYIFVLGNSDSHADQDGDWMILVNPTKLECRPDWDHEAFTKSVEQ